MIDNISNYPEAIRTNFEEIFHQEPLIIRSPGRINLIGEHTDYNMGFVLPAAINKAIYFGINTREDKKIRIHSLNFQDDFEGDLDKISVSGKLWPDYLLGVVEQIQKKHSLANGFNIVFGGDIPPGAGLSSSAALECAMAYGLHKIFDLSFEKMDLVRMAQAAENEFVGVKCGIMDQFASMFGKKDQLLSLDCRSLDYNYVPFKAERIKIVLFDTRVKHSLATSAYNERREQCEAGVKMIQENYPEVKSLRDASEEMLLELVKPKDLLVYNRCSFVVAEINRLQNACKDLEMNNIESFGKRMFETHAGLKDLYEVSCDELDLLVDLVQNDPNVIGARMMGGGFGGCTINLVKTEAVDDLIARVSKSYLAKTGSEMLNYIVEIEDGTSIIN
jgi:galactokinase